MLAFTVTNAGQTLLGQAVAGISPIIIDSIVLYNASTAIKTITEFSGAVVADGSGIGEYVVIRFDDTTATAYTITSIGLKSGSTEIATSEACSVQKLENKTLPVRITAQFTDAGKCAFNSININLPYATQSRDGTIRLAKSSGETHKDRTVYSALDVEALISAGVDGSDKYVPWDVTSDTPVKGDVTVETISIVDDYDTPTNTSTITLNGQTSGVNNISVDGYVTGTAVSSSPTISSGAITGSPKVVNETYISSLYADSVSSANNTKLVTSNAVSTYVASEIQSASANYVHLTGDESIAGTKTFTTGVSSVSYTGTGVQSSTTNWNASANNSKLPTVEVVSTAIGAVETAYQNADSDLQSQIDGINAGQNLADIVDLIGDLTSHSLTGLKAKNDYKHGSSGETWPIGDKIQVLHDKTDASGQVPSPVPDGIATVYELVKGTIDTTTYPKDQASTTTGYYWHYIGEYGVDSYTKSQADARYVTKSGLDQTMSSSSSTTNAPSTKAVSDAIDALETSIEGAYVKLTSATAQTISSEIVIDTGTATGNNADTFTFSGNSLSSNGNSFIGASIEITDPVVFTRTLKLLFEPSSTSVKIGYVDTTVPGGGGTEYIAMTIDCTNHTVSGNAVADYSDILPTPPAAATDGRLVTVDYLNAYTGDLSGYAKLSSANTFTGVNTFDSDIIVTDDNNIVLNYSDEAIPDGAQTAPADNYARLYTNTRHEVETSGDGATVPNVVLDLGPYYYTNDSVAESDGSPDFLIMQDDTRVAQFGSYVYLNQLGRHYDAIPQAYVTQIGSHFYPSTKIYSDQFIKHNGTSSQFLKADGSVDSTSYLTSSSLSNYVTIDTTQTITGSKTFNSISLLPSGASTDSTIVLDTYHYDNDGTDSDSGETCLRPADDEYADLGDYRYKFDNIWAYHLHGDLDGTASSLSTNRHIDGVNFNGTSDVVHFGVCTVTANTQIKDVTIPNFNLNLVTGSRVIVKFSFVNSAANPQLRVNTSGTNGTAKPIVYKGTSAVGSTSYYSWQAGGSVEFVFDGTNWVWVGFQEYVYSASKASSATYLSTANNSSVAAAYYSNPTRAIIPYNSSTTSDIGTSSYRWRTLYLSTSISDGTNTFSLPSSSGTLALTSDIPEEIFCVSSGQSSIEIDSSNDYRDPIPASDPISTNPRWSGNSVSLLVNQYVNLTANLRLSVYVPNQEFVGSIAFPIDAQISGYAAYPIYFRGDTSTHNPVVPQGTILRLTFRQNAFHADFYDLADFGVEHEPIVRIGKVPHHSSDDSYKGALVGIRKDNNKFDTLLTVTKSNGVATSTTMLDTIDCSPVYVSFQGECFSAHPRVPFGVFLCMEYIYSAGLTPSANNVAFDFVTSDSSTIADHIVTNTTVSNPSNRRRYFHVDNAPVFLLTTTNTGHYISIGGIPNGCKGRLIGFLTEGTKYVGLLRLVQDNKIYSGTSTPIEFGVANSDVSTTYTASLQLYNSDTTNYKNGISCTGNLLPSSTNTYSIGSPSLKWGTTYTEIISMGLDNECTISHVSNNTRYEHIVITVTPENKNGSLHIDTSSYSERTGDWSTFEFSFSGDSFYSLDRGDLGISLCPWGCVYTDELYFGVVPSSETNRIACTFTKYSNDTTNYKNGLQCSCNFLPYYNNLYCLGSTTLKWDTVYANQIGDSNNTVIVYGTSSSATESEQLKKTVSSTDYTISLNSSNYWVSNTSILPSVNSTSTSTGKDLGSTSYKWRYLYVYQIGSLSYKVSNAYITNLYFGTANSASSSTYNATLKLYNSDTTNYKNGISCTGNFLPSSTNVYGLGSSTYKWKEAYFSGGNSSYYITIDNTGSQPTIRPSTDEHCYLGSSNYYWSGAYISDLHVKSINLAFVEIDIWGSGSNEAIIKVPYGTTISGTGYISNTDAYVTGIRYANLHFYGTSPNRTAYDEKGTNTDTITGSIKILSHILTWKNGSSVVRSYIVPALIIS